MLSQLTSILSMKLYFFLIVLSVIDEKVQLNSRILLVHAHYNAEIVVKVTQANNLLPLEWSCKMKEGVYQGRCGVGDGKSKHTAK